MSRIISSKVFNASRHQKYRSYSAVALNDAFRDLKDNSLTVAKAARKYCIPEQTLRDRILGHVSIDMVKSGPAPIFDQEQEARLVTFIKDMAAVGYGYTRAEVVDLGSEYAIHMGIRSKDKPLSVKWFYGFLDRWPELKVWRPKTISELRAKATSRESIDRYFDELGKIMEKYGLTNKPESIYNIDEKGITQTYSPPKVVASSAYVPSTLTSERSPTTTIIASGNALGHQIPPYFVFKGARMRQELLEGASAGANGTVSGTGWSNSEIFQSYLQDHFLKYTTRGHENQHVLVLYNGHTTHITPQLIDWAIEHKIILYVLPPHTSHVLQPMDVGCFGAFSKVYTSECHKFQREQSGVVGKYNVCSLACKAYSAALSPSNLQSAFRKSGIYPLDRSAIDQSLFPISNALLSTQNIPATNNETTLTQPNSTTENQINENAMQVGEGHNNEDTSFFQKKMQTSTSTSNIAKKAAKPPRRSIHKITSGKAITESETAKKVKMYIQESHSKPSLKRKKNVASSHSTCKKHVAKDINTPSSSQEAGPSHCQKTIINYPESDSDTSVEDNEKCCVCLKFSPDTIKNCTSLIFTKWAKCDFDSCEHWTHLQHCCDVNVLRRHDKFFCPCHGLPCRQTDMGS